ncbi:energy transducer TonB [Shewanella sp. UCD-KL12]|uniref:energy transducer TonB n=1 Tax=Shewanella sp. UCD-KL12 TaxID=1917163 RepID=UPI0009713ACB|nr:energy transducer TonB [Shewanella sp. UCD-KL12]
MKPIITLALLFLIFLSTSGIVQAKNKVFANILVTDMTAHTDPLWHNADQSMPIYPIELARSQIKGCAVLAFNVSKSGDTENIEVISSVPNRHLGKFSKKIVKRWDWTKTSDSSPASAEKHTVRLDFCLSTESDEHSKAFCQQQRQLNCSST